MKTIENLFVLLTAMKNYLHTISLHTPQIYDSYMESCYNSPCEVTSHVCMFVIDFIAILPISVSFETTITSSQWSYKRKSQGITKVVIWNLSNFSLDKNGSLTWIPLANV